MRFIRVGVPVAVVVLCGATALATARTERSGDPLATQVEAVCGGPPPCTVVNTLADPASDGTDGHQLRFGEAIATGGRPATDCPKVTAAYATAGLKVDAYLGPCPAVASVPSDATLPPIGPGGDQSMTTAGGK